MREKRSTAIDSFRQQSVAVLMLFLLACAVSASAEISESLVTRLENDLVELEAIESTTESRMACKRIVRRAESLVEKSPDSPDRFKVLGIMFEAQKVMFTMRQSQENSEALMATAKQLLDAPDEYAELRVEPDMMLVQMKLSEYEDSPNVAALEIARFADRYRGTSAEPQSLMMAATAAFDTGSVELLKTFRIALSTRCADDPEVAIFMRERFASGSDVHLSGQFKRADGKHISLPIGQPYVVCFWSEDAPLLKDKIAEVKSLQDRYKGQFKVFSFNLDERSDGGRGALNRLALDWIPMLLPGGIDNPTWQAVGGVNLFSAHVVSPYGLAHMNAPQGRHVSLLSQYTAAAETPRRLSLFRSLCIGDYLVADMDVPDGTTVSKEVYGQIRSCFPAPPMRYRLTLAQELQNYTKAEQLCGDVVAKSSKAPDLWVLHNHRVIALLGMWRLTGALDYLDRAVVSAKATLAMRIPPVALTIPQFCIATKALMDEDSDIEQVLSTFVASTAPAGLPGTVTESLVPGMAHAAALMLSLEAHSPDQYIKYRDILMSKYLEDPSVWPVTSFMLDRSSVSRLFEKALPSGSRTGPAVQGPDRVFRSVDLPSGTNQSINAVFFMEPTSDRNVEASFKRVVDHLVRGVAGRPHKDMAVTGVFRCDDTNRVAALMTQNKWSFNTECLLVDRWQRLARELGVFAADLRPNVFLVRPDGTIMLAISGVGSDSERSDVITMRIDLALREYGLELAEKALAAKDYREYAMRLATSFPLKNRRLARHEPESKATSAHGRQLVWAYMQAGEWKQALDAVNRNIAVQAGIPNPRDTAKWCRVCYGHLHSTCQRVMLLRKCGDNKKADEVRASFDVPKCPHGKPFEHIWTETQAAFESLKDHRRWAWAVSNPQGYLEGREYETRGSRQNLYGFGIQSDLMLRATIYEKLGNAAAAKVDRRDANVRAWPFKVREYDPEHRHEARVARSKLARSHLEKGEWQKALDFVNQSTAIHENEAIRCNSMCKICWAQVQSFGFRARTLDGLGRKKEAEASREMAELIKCPPDKELESFKSFPINRMYGGGSGVNRLNFIETVMTGKNCYANVRHRAYRMEFAADLDMRAQALEQLGEKEKAEAARKRAAALAFPQGAGAVAEADGLPERYEDMVRVEE